uniref:hypothetical protein n=1 Tax=Alistipes sp. TaxID=1872444 RepID=UPI0040570A60
AAEGANTNFVAEGYSAVELESGVWTVVEGTPIIVASQQELQDAISSGAEEVLLPAGNYDLGTLSIPAGEITIKGLDKATSVLNISKSPYFENVKLTLENLTVTTPAGLAYNEHNYAFIHHAIEFNMINCNSVGGIRLNVYKANIEDCNFTMTTSSGFDGYAIYYYGKPDSEVKVTRSNFNTAGKAIVIYSEGPKAYNLKVDTCEFLSNIPSTDKAAIQMHAEYGISGKVEITNTTATGFADVNGGLWNELNNQNGTPTDNFDIFVDGTQVH